MIPEISVHARPTNNKAKVTVGVCFASSIILLIISSLLDKYRGLIGIAILALVTVAILLYTKYMLTRYIYDLTTDSDGSPILIARSVTGHRESTLMRLSLSTVVELERLSGEQVGSYRTEMGVLKYIYSPTFHPDSLILIKSRSPYEKADILIEAPDEFLALIREAVQYAKDNFTEEE